MDREVESEKDQQGSGQIERASSTIVIVVIVLLLLLDIHEEKVMRSKMPQKTQRGLTENDGLGIVSRRIVSQHVVNRIHTQRERARDTHIQRRHSLGGCFASLVPRHGR